MKNQYKLLAEKYDQIKKVEEAVLLPDVETVEGVVNILKHARQQFLNKKPVDEIYKDAQEQLSRYQVKLENTPGYRAYCDGRGVIHLNYNTLEYFFKVGDENDIRSLIKHEVVHRHQMSRLFTSLRKDPSGRSYNKFLQNLRNQKAQRAAVSDIFAKKKIYYNGPREIMARAHDVAQKIYSAGVSHGFSKQALLNDIFKNLYTRTAPHLARRKLHGVIYPSVADDIHDITYWLTPENKKRFYRYVYSYVEQFYDRAQNPASSSSRTI